MKHAKHEKTLEPTGIIRSYGILKRIHEGLAPCI